MLKGPDRTLSIFKDIFKINVLATLNSCLSFQAGNKSCKVSSTFKA